ncbi:MAG: ribosome assembly RNA-binding protein YhbY [Myxococcota bacterium]
MSSTPESDPTPAAEPAPAEALPSRPVVDVTGAQKRHLRGLAHKIRPIVFVGEGGISASVAGALDDALTAHELVKVRLRQPNDKKSAAQSLSEATGAALCGVVGHTVVLYRPHPEEPKIVLPTRD